MVGRKAFIRTFEAVLAIGIMFLFLTVFVPQYNLARAKFNGEGVLRVLVREQGFRDCVLQENSSCINSTLSGRLERFNYFYNVSRDANVHPELPARRVVSESILVSGNSTLYDPHIIRVYYWPRDQ